MGRFEQDYRETLDGLAFSGAGKERIMKNLVEQTAGKPAKGRGGRPLRAVLIAAALCAALVGTAFATVAAARQARITYLNPDEFRQGYDDYLEEHGYSSSQYSDGRYDGSDFNLSGAASWETWWQNPDAELVEELGGTAGDKWTAKRVFKSNLGSIGYGLRQGQTYVETRYQAERASDYTSLWGLWDLSWLEERYTANPHGTFARTITYRDELRFLGIHGEYQDGETQFNLGYSWDGSFVHKDEYRVAGNKEFTELYTTADGVEVFIEMDTSGTGKSVFWAGVYGGYNSFSMFGTQMGLDDLHDILDSLHLSFLLEYQPES